MKNFLIICACIAVWTAAAYGDYLEPERKNREYELDLITQRYDREWNEIWQANDNALRISGGSVNVRDLLFRNQLKFKFPLSARLFLRGDLNYFQTIESNEISRHLFERVDTFDKAAYKNVFAFDYSYSGYQSVSLLGVPTFEKWRSDAGVGWKWEKDKFNYVKVEYWWVDFNNNHAFKKEKEFDIKEEFYNKNPREYVFSAGMNKGKICGYLNMVFTTPAQKEYTFYADTAAWYKRETRSNYGNGFLAYRIHEHAQIGGEVFRETGKDDREFLSPLDTHHSYFSRYFISVFGSYKLREKEKAGFEFRWQQKRYWEEFPHNPGADFRYYKYEVFPILEYNRRLNKWWELELALLREAAVVRRRYPANPNRNSNRDTLVDDRLKIGMTYKIGEKTFLKALTGVELDKRDQGKFPYLDKGAVQFLTLF